MSKKVGSYLFSGVLLAYYGLNDLEHFNVIYNGFALVISATSFIMAFIEYGKENTKD